MNKELQDLVWSVLPKEFKEEVKKLYTDALDASNSPHEPDDRKWGNYRVTLLEKLFGIHNLTSDAEGEEMLTVSHKRVQELYSEMQKIVPVSEYDRGFRNAERATLYHLFGSKCLPDGNKECSNPSVVNCKHKHGDGTCSLSGMCCYKSPKPAEPITQFKFKVGDKVVYHPFKSNSFYNAEVLEIRDKEDKPYLLKLEDAENIWAYSVEVQSVAETYPQEPKPAEPDEKDDCKKFTKRLDDTLEGEIKEPFKEWRDKNSSNVEKLEKNGEVEPKPAEPKFKVGDKVVCLNYPHVWRQVTAILEDGSYVLDGAIYDVKESDLEPYTEPEEEVSKMKPIESKVRVYLATKEEDEEFRLLLHKNGFKWHTNTPLINLTCWSSVFEDSHIHCVHPDKTVTYCGKKTSDTLTFSEFKKQYFEENVNLSQENANCDKQFNNILKDSFSKERRLNIAAMVMQGVMANPYWTKKRMSYALRQNENKEDAVNEFINDIIEDAVNLTDALIAEAGKGDKK